MGVVMAKRNLVDIRIDAGFDSQEELASVAGVVRSTVWMAENGRPIAYRSARKIINALKTKGVDLEVDDLNWNVPNKK